MIFQKNLIGPTSPKGAINKSMIRKLISRHLQLGKQEIGHPNARYIVHYVFVIDYRMRTRQDANNN